MNLSQADRQFLDRVHEMALKAEASGNLPIAAILVRSGTEVSAGSNATITPVASPGRHAEMEALRSAPDSVWADASRLTLYTSLEPCIMCFGAVLVHRIGRVVFGALDVRGGALSVAPHLPLHIRAMAETTEWVGPAQPERFDPLARRALEMYWIPQA